jgi:cell division septation protein DedD
VTRVAKVFLVLAIASSGAAAQTDPLQRIEELVSTGRLTQARADLDFWFQANPPGSPNVSAEQGARALLLRGRLSTDPAAAREAYLALVLSYPSTSVAPEALLRASQGLLAEKDARRAATYLQRLVADYPASAHRTTGLLWLARAHAEMGDWTTSCETARQGVANGSPDAEIAALLRTEEQTACARPGEPVVAPAASTQASVPVPRPAMDSTPARVLDSQPPASGASARFTVQVAALRSRENAQALAARIRRAGFEPRLTLVQGSALHRVRIGRYSSSAEATATARRLRNAGFDAIVVDDARLER